MLYSISFLSVGLWIQNNQENKRCNSKAEVQMDVTVFTEDKRQLLSAFHLFLPKKKWN